MGFKITVVHTVIRGRLGMSVSKPARNYQVQSQYWLIAREAANILNDQFRPHSSKCEIRTTWKIDPLNKSNSALDDMTSIQADTSATPDQAMSAKADQYNNIHEVLQCHVTYTLITLSVISFLLYLSWSFRNSCQDSSYLKFSSGTLEAQLRLPQLRIPSHVHTRYVRLRLGRRYLQTRSFLKEYLTQKYLTQITPSCRRKRTPYQKWILARHLSLENWSYFCPRFYDTEVQGPALPVNFYLTHLRYGIHRIIHSYWHFSWPA